MNDKVTVSKRPLRYEESSIISNEIRKTSNVTGYRPSELMELPAIYVVENSTEIIGLLAYVESSRFVDLKLLLIREKFRGQGYGTRLFATFMMQFNRTNKILYAVTKNKIVIKMLKKEDFKQVKLYRLPLAIITHQLKMVFSFYRIKEYLRKYVQLPHEGSFQYWMRGE